MTAFFNIYTGNFQEPELYPCVMPFSELREKIREIIDLAPNNLEEISLLVKYLAQIYFYYDNCYNVEQSTNRHKIKAKNKIRGLLERLTGADYYNCESHPYELVHADNVYRHDEYTYCEEAYNEHIGTCYGCDGNFTFDSMTTHDDEYYCQDCYDNLDHNEDEDEDNPKLLDHSADVTRHVQPFRSLEHEKNPKLYFGVELEVLPRKGVNFSEALNAVYSDVSKVAQLKRDGSLNQSFSYGHVEGFEIVTTPATLGFHRKNLWNDFFREGGSAEKVKSWSTSCCGLHIHFTKAALSRMQLGKVICFYHDPRNNHFLGRIAGRDVDKHQQWCPTSKKTLGRTTAQQATGHYNAINTSGNRGYTCEVRIFRGNASRHGVMRALDFVAAVIDWCNESAADEVSYKFFLDWFNRPVNRARYPDLWKQLIGLGYLKTEHTFKEISPLGILMPCAMPAGEREEELETA